MFNRTDWLPGLVTSFALSCVWVALLIGVLAACQPAKSEPTPTPKPDPAQTWTREYWDARAPKGCVVFEIRADANDSARGSAVYRCSADSH